MTTTENTATETVWIDIKTPNGLAYSFTVHAGYPEGVHEYDAEAHGTDWQDIAREHGLKLAMCGHCERVWDDGVSTTWTPTPSGRCPFEYDHSHSYQDLAEGILPELVEFEEEMARLRGESSDDLAEVVELCEAVKPHLEALESRLYQMTQEAEGVVTLSPVEPIREKMQEVLDWIDGRL